MRLTLFGANGGTGRVLTRQALEAGHTVVAVTRRPSEFPLRHVRLTVTEGDALDRADVASAIAGADAVLSTLGVPFSREPITIYSTGMTNIVAGMGSHGIKRLVAVTSSATYPRPHADGGFFLNRVIQPLVTATIGKTTYADMRRMEQLLRASELAWTVMRPSGLFDAEAVSDYQLAEDHSDGIFTSRADLAASMLAQLDSGQWIGRMVAVTTRQGAPTLLQMLRREAFSRR